MPVLSKTNVSEFDKASRYLLPFTSIPNREVPPIPPKKLSGIEITRAHGQETTRKIKALSIQIVNGSARISGGITAKTRAARTTAGV